MFARKLEFDVKLEKKEEFVRKIREDVLPILKKQNGFFDIMMFFHEPKQEKFLVISLWENQMNAERYEREVFPKVTDILKPYLITPIAVTPIM